MSDDKLKVKKELFERELDKLIEDFSIKRKRYHTNYIRLCWIIVSLNACISFSIGISFVEKVALQFKVIALILSSVLLIFNGAMSFLNYRNLYAQRTKTLINLLALKREYKFRVQYSDLETDFDVVYNKLQIVMKEDFDLWLENIPNENGVEVK